jgi:lanosterol synthase
MASQEGVTNVIDEDVPKHMDPRSRTDYTKWRLLDEKGRLTWHYLENIDAINDWPQSTADKYFLGLPTV